MEKTYTIEVLVTIKAFGQVWEPDDTDPGANPDLEVVSVKLDWGTETKSKYGRDDHKSLYDQIEKAAYKLAADDDWHEKEPA